MYMKRKCYNVIKIDQFMIFHVKISSFVKLNLNKKHYFHYILLYSKNNATIPRFYKY